MSALANHSDMETTMNVATKIVMDIALLPEVLDPPAVFATSASVDAVLADIEAKARAFVPDLSTATGRKAIASMAHTVARSKTALDDAGKGLNDERRAQINVVDAERRKIRDRLDALKDEVRAPLTKWEADEESRKSALRDRLAALDAGRADAMCPAAQIGAVVAEIVAVVIGDDWQEFRVEAALAKDRALVELRRSLAIAEQREAEQAELARLRAEAAAREEADRKRRELEEAEARRVAAEKAEVERQARVDREKQEAVERAARAAEERAKAEAERIARETEAKADAERRAAADREAELKRQVAEAKAREERAAQAERDRIEAESRAAEAARAKREANAKHRARIKAEIAQAVAALNSSAEIAEALISGRVPHVEVRM